MVNIYYILTMWALVSDCLGSNAGSFAYWAVTLDKSFNLFVLQFPHFQDGGNYSRVVMKIKEEPMCKI